MQHTKLMRTALLGASAALVLGLTPSAFAADSNRWAGDNRYETAIKISDSFGSAATVYISRGDSQADAVAGGKLPGGPLLLVSDSEDVKDAVKAQIAKLKATKVVVLGGKDAVSDATAAAVAGTAKVERIAGADRYATAAAISKVLNKGTAPKVYLANGLSLVDALAGGSIPDSNPILLTAGTGKLPQATIAEIKRLKPTEVVALGGEKAVSGAELLAASTVNGAGGGLTEAQAKEKATADLVKADREAQMKYNGYYTVGKGKTLEDFLASAAKASTLDISTPAKKAKVMAEMQTTFPRVLVSEVKATDNTANIFAPLDNGSTLVSAQAAKAAATYLAQLKGQNGAYDTPSYKGMYAINASIAAASGQANAIATAVGNKFAATAAATAKIGAPLFNAAKGAVGLAKLTDPMTGKTLNANTTLRDFAAFVGANVTFPIANADAAAAQTAVKTGFAKLADKFAVYKTSYAAETAKAKAAMDDAAAALTKGATTEAIQKYMGEGGAKTSRLAGADRYLTALQIAKVAYPSGTGAKGVYFANGVSSADATVAGFIDNKASQAGPVLLAGKAMVAQPVLDYLQAAHANNKALSLDGLKLLGGDAVLGDAVLSQAKKALS